MAITVKQLIEELGGTADGSDPVREGAIVLFEAEDGRFRAIDESGGIDFYRAGLPDAESELPVLVLTDGGEMEVE